MIFLTGASEVWTKVQGFELGAVDYITKPFHAAELCARVRAALRAKHANDSLAVNAEVDTLTGLYNRASFDKRLEREFATARQDQGRLALVMLDIDHFKRLNDSYGHPFGDEALRSVGQMLSHAVRGTDVACRYGGEEFALLLPRADAAGAAMLVARVQTQLGHLVVRRGPHQAAITASFGIADAGGRDDAAELLDAADRALYRAKRGGRNRLEIERAPIEAPLPPTPITVAR